MGVPGFYRWAVRKVPGVRHKSSKPPYEFDCLYLDFNGVVHGCVDEWGGQEDEDVFFLLIEAHILSLIAMCQPRVLLYIAIDGVAPRAKMNQQRSRRFRAARDSAQAADSLEQAGRGSFDRNAITPGTDFMVRLSKRLQAWAEQNGASETLRGVTIVISDDRHPGEGEHKIMEVIRHHPNHTHCLVSSDADLVFLGLVSPAEHVYLLRQNQNARGQGRRDAPPARSSADTGIVDSKDGDGAEAAHDAEVALAEEYELLSIIAVRHYLASQFPGADPQRVAADFVAMCCLAGNDFLPHIPAVDIYQGGIDRLLAAYKALSPVKNGFLVSEDLALVLPRWKELLAQFAAFEAEILLEAAQLGLGFRPPPYKGPGPPPNSWDGLSVQVMWAPPHCTAEEVVASMSKAGCTAVSAHGIRGKNGAAGPTFWLVRFADARSALKTIIAMRRIRGNKVISNWVDAASCNLLEPMEELWEAVPWQAELNALVLDCFEFWLGAENLSSDAFLRRHVRSDPQRFVPISVFLMFARMKTLLQDCSEIARILRTSELFEVRGDGDAAVVRAVTDFSVQPSETPEKLASQQAALRCVSGHDFVGAVRFLRPEYYARHHGPSVGEPSAIDDADFSAMERNRSHGFLQGIEWVVRYYIRGCSSWSWFYPAHYPPLCVGIMNQTDLPLETPSMHAPFTPELQLMAVLPPQSALLLPQKLRCLLLDKSSPVADFYPSSFEVDRKEDDREWQGVALLPFVDEARLRSAVQAAVPEGGCTLSFGPPHAFRMPVAKVSDGKGSGWSQALGARLMACCSQREVDAADVAKWDFQLTTPLAQGQPRGASPSNRSRPEEAVATATPARAAKEGANGGGRRRRR